MVLSQVHIMLVLYLLVWSGSDIAGQQNWCIVSFDSQFLFTWPCSVAKPLFIYLFFTYLETQHHAFVHLLFALSYGLCVYNFVRAITLDPGTCPKPSSDGELRAVRIISFSDCCLAFLFKNFVFWLYWDLRLSKILHLRAVLMDRPSVLIVW